jgi:hypothetical protein
MEQQDFTPIGGSWVQDSAYSLRQIIAQANELLLKCDSNGNQIITAIGDSETNVINAIGQSETNVIQTIAQSETNVIQTIAQSETNVIQTINDQDTTVEVVTYIYHNPSYQYVHNPLPIITPKPNQKIVYKQEHIIPPPRIIDVDKMNAYQRVCGSYNPINDGYHYCMRCVDKWLAANQDGFELQQLTRSGTGCTTKRPKRCCKPNGMPY